MVRTTGLKNYLKIGFPFGEIHFVKDYTGDLSIVYPP